MERKEFPDNFPPDAVSILNDMSFLSDNVMIAGSAGLRSMQYAGDYDGFEVVDLHKEDPIRWIVTRFKSIVLKLKHRKDLYIGDIKCGTLPEYQCTKAYTDGKKVYDYNPDQIRERIPDFVTPSEMSLIDELLVTDPTPEQLVQLKDLLKFDTVRWSPNEVERGYTVLRDGRRFTLEEGVLGKTKVDVVGFVENNRWTDFSVIYEFRNNGKVLNPSVGDAVRDITEDIVYYRTVGNNFKALKRMFSLAVLKNKLSKANELIPVFNSDLGRLYRIISDIHTLIYLLENKNVPVHSIKTEIGQFIGKLSNIYTLKDYLKDEGSILAEIGSALQSNKNGLASKLLPVVEHLEEILNRHTEKYL